MKIKALLSIFAIASVLLIVSCNSPPDPDKVVLNDKKDSISYVIGLDYGTGLQRQFVDYNPEAMYKGLVHAQNGEDLISDSIKLLLITDINQG
ncbi:MAG: FKBP-type peptidyl-prolyl cis-trans isomerase N-terminal domain-containing protein, partial [Bacteroidales bacterium]|nr:FKBP-type peptidyl-prolyl cis-trans isomerase N-terminal domain-containing protein [Bacteroidales bacterium]